MKNKNTKRNQTSTGNNQINKAEARPEELAVAQRWWESLEPIEKVGAFEGGVVAQALKGEVVHKVLAGEVALKKAYDAFMYEVWETFETRPWVLMHFYDPRPKPCVNGASGAPGTTETPEQWWAKLSAADKRFAHELGIVTLAFKNGLAANALSSPESLMEVFMNFRKGLKPVYEKGAALWAANRPKRREWN